MRQAIITKYLGPTNTRGARVVAKCQAGYIIMSWYCDLDVDENHNVAAKALATKLGWVGRWVGGGLPTGTGNCYVHSVGANHYDFVVTDSEIAE